MARRGIKQEKPVAEEVEEVEEVVMPQSMNPRKSRTSVTNADVEMSEALPSSNDSFPAMPTPVSFVDDGLMVPNFENKPLFSGPVSHALRSAAPSAETGLHVLGNRVQILVDAIQDFREFGVDHVVQLPELVLVGDQSAGKSSLMSALAEIHLPQSAGCCTRCPAHIKTSPAGSWTCKISLEREYSYEPRSGRPIDSKDVTKNRQFPPWVPQDLEVRHFMTIHDKYRLEEALRWAQVATLNHNKHHSMYIPDGENFQRDDSTEAKFSPNVVSVEISGPGLHPLSFYDLPGVFQNAGQKEDQYLVKVVENLAMKYIARPQALIICALPMSADPATSRTAKVIADQGATDRCLGVLTKADQLQEGQSVDEFHSMLKGSEYQLGLGYYATKQPGPGVKFQRKEAYHAVAREAETEFFSTHPPWNSEWAEFKDRFGTRKLAEALSLKLAGQIADSIPQMEEKINRRAQEIASQLSDLPDLPAKDILGKVRHHLLQFDADLRNMLDGGSSNNRFHSSWQKLCDQFCETILEMKPRMVLRDPADQILPDVINIDDDSDASTLESQKGMSDESPTPRERKRKYEQSTPSVPRFRSDATGSSMSSPISHHDGQNRAPNMNGATPLPHRMGSPSIPRTPTPRKQMPAGEPNPFSEYLGIGKNSYKLREIRSIITTNSRTGLPGVFNDNVYSEMCLQSVTPWEAPMNKMMGLTLHMLQEHSEQILLKILSKWQQTELFKQSKQLLQKFLIDLGDTQRTEAKALYDLETYRLFTVNTIAYERYRQEEGDILRKSRRYARAKEYVIKDLSVRRKVLDEAGMQKAIADVKDELLGKDPFETEINVAAYVRGYYKTAALRFLDSFCLSIYGKLFRNVYDSIPGFLFNQLELDVGDGESRCRELMEENKQIATRRAKLRKEQDSLNKFSSRLFQLRDEYAASNVVESESDAEMDQMV